MLLDRKAAERTWRPWEEETAETNHAEHHRAGGTGSDKPKRLTDSG